MQNAEGLIYSTLTMTTGSSQWWMAWLLFAR